MENPRDRLVRYLQDMHAAEVGITDTLREFVGEVNNMQVRAALQEHLTVTEGQAARLEQRLRALGEEPSGGKGFLNKMMGKIGDMLQGAHDEWDKTTQDLIKAYATEHLEMGMYAALASYARAFGDEEAALLAEQIMGEEKDAAERLRPMIVSCAADTYAASVAEQRAA